LQPAMVCDVQMSRLHTGIGFPFLFNLSLR
jgi:hypothetical protein